MGVMKLDVLLKYKSKVNISVSVRSQVVSLFETLNKSVCVSPNILLELVSATVTRMQGCTIRTQEALRCFLRGAF